MRIAWNTWNLKTHGIPVLLLSLLLLPEHAQGRTWTDNTGNFQVEAELVTVDENVVTLRKDDGRVIAVPLDRLSAADRKFLAERRPALGGDGAPDEEPPRRPLPMGGDEGGAAPEAMLTRRVRIQFQQTPLRDAIDFLSTQAEGPILVDQRALRETGVAVDAPVTQADEGALHDVLARLLKPMGLEHIVHHDVVLITSKEAAESKYLTARVYRLRRRVDMDEVVTAITRTVAPDSWDDVGGRASVQPLSIGGLLVAQSWAAHHQIEKSFGDLLQPLTPPDVPGTTRLAKALAARHPVELKDAPLENAADYFGELLGTRVRLDKTALDDEGISTDTPVTLPRAEVPVASALSLTLEQLGLAWAREKGDIVITTPAALDGKLKIVRYGVKGLSPRPDARDVTVAITSTVFPASWDHVGGTASVRTVAPGQVVIRHHDAAHRAIETLLATMQGKK